MSNYVVRRTVKWRSTVSITLVDKCSTMEEALDLMETYRKGEQGLVDTDWCDVTGFCISVDEKWDGHVMTIASVKGGDYSE